MTINQGSKKEDLEKVKILFNGIRLSEGLFDGKFFTDRSVTLKGEATDDENVISWTITTVGNDGTSTTTTAQGEEYSFNMPSCKRLDINATIGKSTGIRQVGNRQWTWTSNGNMLRLSGVERGTTVRLFNLQGQMLWQATASGNDMQILLPSGEIHLLKVGSETLKIR